jgi:hypothetical protein
MFSIRTALIVAALAASTLAVPAPTNAIDASRAVQHRSPGVCGDIARCHVKARVDVTGDGVRDAIAVIRLGDNGSASSAVTVRVKTGSGRIVSTTRPTQYWYGPVWQGVANLDARPGKEIVVGNTMGAHTQFYLALTWRHRALVRLGAPGPGTTWMIDSAVWISAGWLRRPHDPLGTIVKRVAVRTGDATQSPFRGKVSTYRWAHGDWHEVASKRIYPVPDRRAYSWGGFHVPGLPLW